MSDAAIIIWSGIGSGLFVLVLAAPAVALMASHRRDRRLFAKIRALSDQQNGGSDD